MGQLLRQGGRFGAMFYSELLIWVTGAGLFEILSVLFAGTICVLTLGFIFEGMKKNPVVLVLGTALALTGTFLVFREVRGLIWSPDSLIVEKPLKTVDPPQPLDLRRSTSTTQPQVVPPAKSLLPSDLSERASCSGLTRISCATKVPCRWSPLSERYEPQSALPPGIGAGAAGTTLNCNFFSKLTCHMQSACYWSALTDRCEKLRFGASLFAKTPPAQPPATAKPCLSRQKDDCLSSPDCKWLASFSICYDAR